MIQLKDYFWGHFKKNALQWWIILCVAAFLGYGTAVYVSKKKILYSTLDVAAYTVHASLNAGDFPLAINHLLRLEHSGSVFGIKLDSQYFNQNNFSGPFGLRPIGLGQICDAHEVSNGINLHGCVVIFGYTEIITITIFFLIIFSLLIIVYRYFKLKMIRVFDNVTHSIETITNDNSFDIFTSNNIKEIEELNAYVKNLLIHVENATREATLGKMSVQIAHDIRSPLAALNMNIKNILFLIPDANARLMQSATKRISDIASELLVTYKRNQRTNIATSEFTNNLKDQSISLMINSIILEKNIQYHEKQISLDVDYKDESAYSFIKVNPIEFKRSLSNIINNGIEAISNHGKISLTVCTMSDILILTIEDTGTGITQEMIDKLLSKNNKTITSKQDGHGLGFLHTKEFIRNSNGTIDIKSSIGVGTKIIISLPTNRPEFIHPSIHLNNRDIVIIHALKSELADMLTQRINSLTTTPGDITVYITDNLDSLNKFILSNIKSESRILIFNALPTPYMENEDHIHKLFNTPQIQWIHTIDYERTFEIENTFKLTQTPLLPISLLAYIPIIYE